MYTPPALPAPRGLLRRATAPRRARTPSLGAVAVTLFVLSACSSAKDATTAPPTSTASSTPTFKSNPCSATGTLQLGVAQASRVDCSNGGTTLTLQGGGASYLIVPEFATGQGTNTPVSYTMSTGGLIASASSAALMAPSFRLRSASAGARLSAGLPLQGRPMLAQRAADRLMMARGVARARSVAASAQTLRASRALRSLGALDVPVAGSVRTFHVASNLTPNTAGTWKTVAAKLAYAGSGILLYVDTLAPANGFTSAQLQAFGHYFDQTLDSLAVSAFGNPSDMDGNGHVIMLMSPVVNADTPSATCQTQGYVAGFFDPGDFDGATNANSNQGEIFYSIVPDPLGTVSCAHSVAGLGDAIPATFLHEMQHLINYSQHVVLSGGAPLDSWLDEGLSIVAEELGSTYFEQKCPPPACRTTSTQLFPDSAQGFVQSMLYDSYQFALLPDTASLTLHSDDENGFSWRGGDWLLMRWLGDQMGSGIYKKLEQGPANGIVAIEQATGQGFPALLANFGLALYTDSLPGLPRNTAPAANRFTSRNVKQLWARIFATSGGSSDIPLANPVQLFSITADTSASIMVPGTMTFFRLDTPATSSTVTIRFAAPGGAAFPSALQPQLAVFRLPPGQ